MAWQGAIQEENRYAGQSVGDEHEAQRVASRRVELDHAGIHQDLRNGRRQRTDRGAQGTDEGVARKQESARLAPWSSAKLSDSQFEMASRPAASFAS